MSFAWLWCWLLLPLPWLLTRLWPPTPAGLALRVPVLPKGAAPFARRADWLAALAWLLLVAAAARPQLPHNAPQASISGRDLLLAVDVSASMANIDLQLDGQAVQRLQAARLLAAAFLQRRTGDRVGLIVFGRQAYLHTPLTTDLQAVQAALAGIDTGLAGNETALGDAIALGVKHLRAMPDNARVLVLLTDGANTAGTLAPQRAAWLAGREGVRVHALGIASSTAGDLDEHTLQQVATQTSGSYLRATDGAGIERFFRQLDQVEPPPRAGSTPRAMRELYAWPLAGAMLLACALLLRRMHGSAA